ncbi:hypothetical protein AGLY_017958 [Aphis glycines]|uniref:Uncharacterized protein n=1 Tax=Aphis glycines TaxID=307491 RepID=A0A6G0STR7_APHGL|nr:hypothetical protein AGLY_017958 [Aphis glycines]
MEMENFKELLNKCNTQYEFVKICDLEQGKKYEVTCFENINTKFVNIKLPNIYPNKITEKEITVYNTNSQRKLNVIYTGLESMYLKGLNLINIESDCKIEIEQRVIHIKRDEYTISNLNKLIEPIFLSYDNKTIQIESPCYFNLDENLKKYLGFPNTTFDFSILCNTLMYCPPSEEKYINIDKECEFTIDKEDENSNSVYKIPIDIYSLDDLEKILNCNQNEHNNIKLGINKKNFINITTYYNYTMDDI